MAQPHHRDPSAPDAQAAARLGRGEMADRVRTMDWAATPLGATATWSETLWALLGQVLASPMPCKLVWGPDLTQIYNDAYIPVLGHKHPAALGVPMRVSSPEIWADSASVYRRTLDPASPDHGRGVFETDRPVRVRTHAGEIDERLFTVGYAPVSGPREGDRGMVVTLVETTERVRAERLLDESRERLDRIVEHAEVGILQTDLASRIVFANPAFCALLGRDEASLRGMRIADITHADDIAPNMAAFAAMLGSGQPFEVEKRYLRRDGSVVWVRNSVSFVLDAAGRRQSVVAIVQDITAQRAMADELERLVAERTRQLAASESRAQALFENSPDLQVILRESAPGVFTFVDVNPAVLAAMGGVAREDVIGRTPRDFYPDDIASSMARYFRQCLDTDQPVIYEAARPLGGASRWFETTLSRLPTAEVEGGYLIASTLRDITQRRALEEQLRQAQKMEAVGQLTGGIAHDFNNLLTAITGNLELIERKTTDAATRRRAMNAMRAASRGAELTGQLLAFSRRQFLNLVPTSLNEVVTGMTDMLARTMGGRVQIERELAPDLWPALADATQIETALLNLAINARDAMPHGGTVLIRTQNVSGASPPEHLGRIPDEFAGRDAVLVTVSDTGTGMSEAVLARVFEPFFTTKDVGKGSGLGLSMVYGVAKQLGGAVAIASTEGHGTHVGIFLAVAPADAECRAPPPVTTAPPAAIGGADIMVVDDDHDVRELTASFLREVGHRVVEAAAGADVLTHLARGARCDLLLLDLAMPGLSGPETARRARALRPGLAVLFASGYPDVAHFAPDEDARLLRKPFSFDDLAREVAQALASQVR